MVQVLVLLCALGTVAHIVVDIAFTVSVAPGSKSESTWKFVVMVLSLVLPCMAQAWAVSTTMKAEAAASCSIAMWQQRHKGTFPVFFLLGCVRPDLMVSLMRCRAFSWDLFDAPLRMGTSSYLTSFSLISTALHDIPQIVAQWGVGTLLARVAMGCGLASLLYTLASRWSALLFLSASARVRHRRPAQQWGRDEVDPLLLEWIVALDVCHSKARGGLVSYDRYRKEGLRKLRAATRHELSLILPVVIDEIGSKDSDGQAFTDLSFDIHRQVPTATANEGSRVLQEQLGIKPSSISAVRNSLRDTVDRMLAHDDTIDIADEFAMVPGQQCDDTWAVFERLADFLVHRVGSRQGAGSINVIERSPEAGR